MIFADFNNLLRNDEITELLPVLNLGHKYVANFLPLRAFN